MMRKWAVCAGYLCIAVTGAAQAFKPAPLQPATIRSWGDDAMRGVMRGWEQAFRRYHPEITFEDTLLGSGSGMAGTITGVSDMSLMGRPVTANEVIGFEWVHRVKPLGFSVLTGKAGEGRSAPLGVYVAAANPVRSISMEQLAAVLGCPVQADASVTWSAAGATGIWAGKPLHAYVFDDQEGSGVFLQQALQGARDCWNWSVVHEFKDGPLSSASQQILAAVRRDPEGLGIAIATRPPAGLKRIAVNGIEPTVEAEVSGAYPLARRAYIYIHRARDKAVEPKVAEFLRFVLSDEGQAIAMRQGDYLPLNEAALMEQRAKLE